MNKERKRKHVQMEPVVTMKVCGPIALGDQSITSKCMKAMKDFKARYEGKQLEDKLREHLYKDIERLIVIRRAEKRREMEQLTRHWNKEMSKVAPRL